ncbi:sensor histidine kinase [Bacillus fonticola]|uniref:sensor histidine kinase n=1 Tax=Bacillus fonticola TaxID=2728853 RepID=UPI001473FBDB|nr:HAMP domain-containing sensor histidine kinase [Bacillus fonticola]
MKVNRIDVKLGLTMMTVFLLVFLPFGFVINQVFSDFYYSKVRQEAQKVSFNYAKILTDNRSDVSLRMIEMVSEISQNKLVITNSQGQLISHAGVTGMMITLPEDALPTLSNGDTVEFEYTEPNSNKRYLILGQPILNEDSSFFGGLFVLSSIEDVRQSLQTVRGLFMLSGIGGFFLALAFTVVASRKLSAPLVEMERATRSIAKGNLETQVVVRSQDEAGSLGNAINDLSGELKRYRDSRSEFFASISHELKTPVSYLKGYAEVLKEKLYQTEEEKEQYLSIIEHEATRLSHLISDLFDLSKMEEGKFDLHKEWVNLSEMLERLNLKYSMIANKKGLGFKIKSDDPIPLLFADQKRLEEIFTNLLDNAIRHTDVGDVTLLVTKTHESTIRMTIKDTGHGIPEKELPFIFERFYRVEKSRSRQFGGTGLGLAIVSKLVELHNGQIEVESKEGKGTQFKLTFPITTG